MPVTKKRKKHKRTERINFLSKIRIRKPAPTFVKREFLLREGQNTFSIWLTESDIAKGNVKQQVAKAFGSGYIGSFVTNRFVISRAFFEAI